MNSHIYLVVAVSMMAGAALLAEILLLVEAL